MSSSTSARSRRPHDLCGNGSTNSATIATIRRISKILRTWEKSSTPNNVRRMYMATRENPMCGFTGFQEIHLDEISHYPLSSLDAIPDFKIQSIIDDEESTI